MRLYLLYVILAVVLYYTRRNWFIGLCALFPLTAIITHPDMPRSMFGIPGANVWNLLCGVVLISRFEQQAHHPPLPKDTPTWARNLFLINVILDIFTWFIAICDLATDRYNMIQFTTEFLLNPLKYMIPALLLYDACRDRRRIIIGLICILSIPGYYSGWIVKNRPWSSLQSYGRAEGVARRRIGQGLGFHANSAAMCCAAFTWAVLPLTALRKRFWHAPLCFVFIAIGAMATSLCFSRAGYWALLGVGIIFAVFLYRTLLLTLPVILVLIPIYFPGVAQRFYLGIAMETASGETVIDMEAVSAGRMGPFWDGVIADAWESPIIGHGRCAMRRRPMMVEVCRQIGMGLPEHPHCAYLQLWHESGFVGVVIVLSLFFTAWWLALTVARDRRDPLFRAVGGAALAAITALIIMGISGQSFFPKENNQMCWALMGLLLRVWVERKKKAEGHHDLQSMKEPEGYPMAAHPLYVGR